MSKKLYTEGDYLKKNPSWHSTDSAWKAMHILKMISGNNLKPVTICEIGCGFGEILNQLYLKMPDNVTFSGYDISSQAINVYEDKENDRLCFYLADFPARSIKSLFANIPRKILFKINQDITARILGDFSLMVLTQ